MLTVRPKKSYLRLYTPENHLKICTTGIYKGVHGSTVYNNKKQETNIQKSIKNC